MKRWRRRSADINGQYGTVVIPCNDDATVGQIFTLDSLYQEVTQTALRELDLVFVLERGVADASSGDTPLVMDVAVLVFESNGPFGLKVPIIGPGDIFTEDDITVDDSNADIAALVSFVLAHGVDRAGNAITAYLGGKREGAGGP